MNAFHATQAGTMRAAISEAILQLARNVSPAIVESHLRRVSAQIEAEYATHRAACEQRLAACFAEPSEYERQELLDGAPSLDSGDYFEEIGYDH